MTVLAVVASFWTEVVRRTPSVVDFIGGVWAPGRSLLRGVDPFDKEVLLGLDGARHAAPLYAPATYLLHLPLLALPMDALRWASPILCLALLWAAFALLVRPERGRDWLVLAALGLVVTRTMQVHDVVEFGQITMWALFGAALAIEGVRRDRPWMTAVGFALVALKPQTFVPLACVLLLLGRWRTLLRATVVLAVTSFPGALFAVWAAGGVRQLAHSLSTNYELFNHLRWNELGSPGVTRSDLLAIVDRFGGPALNGTFWSIVSLVVVLAFAAIVLVPAGRRFGDAALLRPTVWWVVAASLVLPMYHQPYDLVVAFVPIALMVRRLDRLPPRGEAAVLAAAAGFLAVSVAGTWNGQARLVRLLHVDAHSLTLTFHVLPSIALATTAVVAVLAGRRYDQGS